VAKVEKSAATGTLRTIGRVVVEEDRVFPVTAGGEGWVTQLAPGTAAGDFVMKGQALAVVYGREYATADRTFLYALRSLESSRSANLGNYQDQPVVVTQEARLVLQNMGFGDAQIQQLEKSRQVNLDIKLTAPADGVIVARNVFVQRKFTVPTVANGKVYIGTRGNDSTQGSGTVFGELDVFGLLPN
jgi:hypothetical protein